MIYSYKYKIALFGNFFCQLLYDAEQKRRLVFLTNNFDLPALTIAQIYKGRWRIELVFKRFKSLLGGGHVPKTSDASALAWMQAKILTALLLERVLLEGRFLSPELLCPDEVSRWRIVLEVRDCLQRVLAPPLSLPHLLHRGCAIASASRTGRSKRPLQMTQIRKIFASAT